MQKNQPGVVVRFQAKPGKGEELFKLCTEHHFTGDPDGPVDWVLSRDNDNPDVMWAFEFYRDDVSFDRHYSNPILEESRQLVLDLLADAPLRVDVHIVSASRGNQ